MAKSINVSGRMSVERFNGEFQKAFGVRCNVKISKWVNADGKATLASIRPKDFKGPSKVDLSIVGNMTVGTLKKRFEENFGVMIELYIGRKIAPDDVTIGAIREGRAKVSKGEKQKETAPKTTKPDKPNITDELNDTPEPDKPTTQKGEDMKVKIQLWETLKTDRLHEMVIETDEYPDLKGKTKDEIAEYLDENIWDMNPSGDNADIFESLGEQLLDDYVSEETPAPEYDEIEIVEEDE